MHLTELLDMTVSGYGNRLAFSEASGGISFADLAAQAAKGAMHLRSVNAERLVFIGETGIAFPVALFAAAKASVPFVPLNYRLGEEQLRELLADQADAFVVSDKSLPEGVVAPSGIMLRDAWLTLTSAAGEVTALMPAGDADDVALLLYTSGTSSRPKAAILRHRHLTSYILNAVEFASAAEDAASLVSVPPYHIAGVANVLSNMFAGRRVVFLPQFEPEIWLRTVRQESISNAMLVPTMLARIVDTLEREGEASTGVPSLTSISYGGARMPLPVLEKALQLFPQANFVNAYGLTETSSTIALLGPDDHRIAITSNEPNIRARLASVGQLLPGVECEIRDAEGTVLARGGVGEVFLRGPTISGEYGGSGSSLDDAGWFATRDRGHMDAEGYLYIEGRADDTIIRGGENIAPAEIEDVLMRHLDVLEAVVVGLPDDEWGQQIAAAVVLRSGAGSAVAELRDWVKSHLRSSKTPQRIVIWDDLPRTDTGKIVRRHVLSRLLDAQEQETAGN